MLFVDTKTGEIITEANPVAWFEANRRETFDHLPPVEPDPETVRQSMEEYRNGDYVTSEQYIAELQKSMPEESQPSADEIEMDAVREVIQNITKPFLNDMSPSEFIVYQNRQLQTADEATEKAFDRGAASRNDEISGLKSIIANCDATHAEALTRAAALENHLRTRAETAERERDEAIQKFNTALAVLAERESVYLALKKSAAEKLEHGSALEWGNAAAAVRVAAYKIRCLTNTPRKPLVVTEATPVKMTVGQAVDVACELAEARAERDAARETLRTLNATAAKQVADNDAEIERLRAAYAELERTC
ncbi:MAG TPA: hypothetical protein VEA63_09660, partial [Opitutus sp.]|nr:hypothetical protein [Opitutus sp.]